MHTTTIEYEDEDFTIHHNGDYSGDVKISLEAKRVVEGGSTWAEVDIPFEVLKIMVANAVRIHQIQALEEASTDEILGMEWEDVDEPD